MDESSAPLVPVEERIIQFYDDELVALVVGTGEDRQIYVPVKPIADYIGLDWASQYQRIQRDPILSEAADLIVVTTIKSGRGRPDMLCLPADMLHGWLFGISANRVRPELRDKVLRYQRECYRVLWDAFRPPTAPAPDSPLLEARNLALAVARLADEQLWLERRINWTDEELASATEVVQDLSRRVSLIEDQRRRATVTEDQAAEISQAVKALAGLLAERQPGRNHYQGVFAELYRRFGVSSYKLIRQAQFDDVLRFLDDWRAQAGG